MTQYSSQASLRESGELSKHVQNVNYATNLHQPEYLHFLSFLFPDSFPLQHFDLDLDLKELVIAGRKIRDVRLTSIIENRVLKESPFAATFRNSSLSGHYSLDLAGKEPKIYIGAILEEASLVDDIIFQLDRVKTDLESSGRTLKELVNNLVFSI